MPRAIATRYPSSVADGNGAGKAVEHRANKIRAEYIKKARDLDTVYGNTPPGANGPCFLRLMSFGFVAAFVFGHFGEVSNDVERWISSCAHTAAAGMRGLVRARSENDARGYLAWAIRRHVSWAHFNARAQLRIERTEFVGPGGDDAARRRRFDAASRKARKEQNHYNGFAAFAARRAQARRAYHCSRDARRDR